MDPVAPWSAYAASYNRLANAGSFQNASSSELHHHMGGAVQTAPTSTSQLLAAHATTGLANSSASPFNPTGFLSPPPVGYDPVFTPLFHQKAHYGIQPRPIKQVESDSYNQMNSNNFYEQNNGSSIPWSQNSAQLPSPFGILPHESVVASSSGATPKTYENFNAHFAAAQSLNQLTDYKNSSFIDPKKRPLSPPKPSISAAAPFFQQMFTPPSEPNAHYKQNDYISKNFQSIQSQQNCSVSSPPNVSKEYRIPQPPRSQYPQQRNEVKPRAFTPKQTVQKQPKLYDPEKRNDNESQSSPISYAMMDSQRGFQSSKIRSQQFQQMPNQQPYRFPMTPESDYQRSKSTESFGSTSSNPDCNIGIPRRASPIHPNPSPSIPTQSPVYPMYNSPLTTISSPSPVQHDSCYNKQPEVTPPLDVTVSRNTVPNSVITRIDGRYDRQDYSRQQWDERQRRYSGYDLQNTQSRQQYYDPNNQVTLQDLSSCRGDPMSLVKNLQQQQPEKPPEETPKKRKKSLDKHCELAYVPRVPPPAHLNANQLNQNGFLDIDRWNMNSSSTKSYSATTAAYGSISSTGDNSSTEPSSLVLQHSGPPLSYYPAFNLPQTETSEVQPESTEPVCNKPKVIFLNIVEELQCLLENSSTEECLSKRRLGPNPNIGFMESFKKFLQGEKESSPPPKSPIQRLKIKMYPPKNLTEEVSKIPEFPSDPQDDPRYFPLPKSSEKRKFNSSESECSDNEISIDQIAEVKENISASQEEQTNTNLGNNNETKKKKKKDKKKKKKKSKKRDSPEDVVPLREVSKRKAKEKSAYCLIDEVDAEHHIPELHESDSDPPWSPEEGADASSLKCSRRISMRNKNQTTFKESSEEEQLESDSEKETRLVLKRRISISASKKPSEKSLKKPPPQIIYPSKASSKSNNFPYNIGEFVVLKSDTHLRHPPIWRATEKAMLQKFIHFVEKGMSFYQNLRFFTGWSPENKKIYEGVIVKIISTNKQDMVVELLSNDIHELEIDERPIANKLFEETSSYHENFEIYIQTLFSQALDANFLNEIFQEQDEYFLQNVQAIDNFVSDLEKRLIEKLNWPKGILSAVQTLMSYKCEQKGGKTCLCGNSALQIITFSGVPYNKNTLEFDLLGSSATAEVALCRNCLSHLETFHNLSHFKHSLYSLCEVKVNERKEEDFEKDTTSILNEMLADEPWLKQTFDRVRRDWGYAEVLINKLKNSSSLDV